MLMIIHKIIHVNLITSAAEESSSSWKKELPSCESRITLLGLFNVTRMALSTRGSIVALFVENSVGLVIVRPLFLLVLALSRVLICFFVEASEPVNALRILVDFIRVYSVVEVRMSIMLSRSNSSTFTSTTLTEDECYTDGLCADSCIIFLVWLNDL